MKTEDLKLYTLQEVAEILKVSRQTIYNYKAAKRLKVSKIGRAYTVTEKDLQACINGSRNA